MKRIPRPKKTERAFTASEMAEALLSVVPEMNESFSRADLELALDDRGWINLNASNYLANTGDADPTTRKFLVTRSRMYWHRDPLAHQAVRLWTDYGIGDGISFNSTGTGVMDRLNKFWKARANRRLLSSRGLQRLSRKLLVDGELFFAIFGAPDAQDKKLRLLDPLQVTDRITDPDDDEHILAYRRMTSDNKTLYYMDWAAEPDDVAIAEEQIRKQFKEKTVSIEEDVVIYHLPYDEFGWRGNGLLIPALDWSREHRRFMEARVAITKALSKFAHKLTMKGGQALIDQMKKRLQSSHVDNGANTIEKNPTPASGSTWLQNNGIELEQMPRATGAGDAKQDSDGLKLMVCAATNIMLHYFGDPSTGNLATATAMELPMLKSFTGYQKLWADAIRDLFSIVLNEQDDLKPAVIDIDMAPILKDDLRNLGTAIQAIAMVFPEIAVDEVLQAMLIALGINNVEDVMDSIREKRQNDQAGNKALQDKLQQMLGTQQGGQPQLGGKPAASTPQLNAESVKDLTAALIRVAEAMAA